MSVLSRQQILEARDLKEIKVAVPEWGGDVVIREMSAAERLEFERATLDVGARDPQFLARLLAFVMRDDQGERFFDPSSTEELALLQSKSSMVISRLADRAFEINKLEVMDLQQDVQNLGDPQSADLHSD